MKKSILIFAFISLFIACSSDTEIEGQVVDEQDQPIEDVMVQVMSSDIYVMTDENGRFSLDTKERGNELIFKKEGYEMLLQPITKQKMTVVLIEKKFGSN